MATLLVRNKLVFNQLRQLHKSAVAFSAPNIDVNKETKEFKTIYPDIVNSIITSPRVRPLPEVGTWIKEILDYTMSGDGGWLRRGLTVPIAYHSFEKPENITAEIQHSARIVGWCLEMVQAYLLIVDDVIDSAITRRGKPCWYRLPKVGTSAINDGLLIYQSMSQVLELNFKKEPYYTDLISLINEAVYLTTMGQYLDFTSGYKKGKDNLDTFTIDRYNHIVEHKTCYYWFRLPVRVALLFIKNGEKMATKELDNICMKFGKLQQLQDDYIDAFGDEAHSGKKGRDIQEGKCNWMAVTTLERCNEAQRKIFKECFGSENEDDEQRIKQLYKELKIKKVHDQYKRTVHDDLLHQIHALPTEGQQQYFLELLKALYGRPI